MQNSKEWMKEGGFTNKISFADGAAHTVKLLGDKIETATINGDVVKGMKYLVEEAGEKKTIFTASVGLVSKLSACEINDVVTIKMGKANNKSFYTVTKADGAEIKTADDDATSGAEPTPPAQAEW